MQNISRFMKHMYDTKLIAMRDGNISFKPARKNYFYITPGSVKKNNLVEEDLVRVAFSSDFESKKSLHISNHILNLKPSREINMHAIFHTKKEYYNKDLYILHAHPKNLISYIGLKKNYELKNIKNVFPEININIGKNVSVQDAGSLTLAFEAYNNLRNHDIVGLRNHGSLSMGPCLSKLIEDVETLEYYLEIANNSTK